MKKWHVECTPDETLLKMLGVNGKQIEHHSGKDRVCHRLSENNSLIGLVDEDPYSAQNTYFKNCHQISFSHHVRELQDKKRGNKLIVLCPKLEDWILYACSQNSIKPATFGLSKTGNDLHKEINYKLSNFERLIQALTGNGSAELKHLKDLLAT
jgi:hypothetical protein